MTYDELMETIAASSKQEWLYDGENHWIYKGDLSIVFENTTEAEEGEEPGYFHEEWAEGLGQDTPHRAWFTIYYGASTVRKVPLTCVDGTSPCPRGGRGSKSSANGSMASASSWNRTVARRVASTGI